MDIILVDLNPDLVASWREMLGGHDRVQIVQGSIFSVDCDALVSPANSFGYMDGGLDLAISQFFGWHVQDRLQQMIREKHYGELLVGRAEIVPSDHAQIPFVISAPTMRVPMILRESVNVYLAMRALLLLVKHGKFDSGERISSQVQKIAVPGMGTGVGQVATDICAWQMKNAIDDVIKENRPFPSSWHEAQTRHQLLYSSEARDLQY